MEEMKQNGLCFGCGAIWSKEHRCRRSQLYNMLLEDLQDEGDSEEFVNCVNRPEELTVVRNGEEQVELSIHAMQGTTGFQTMWINGYIKKHKLIILVDSWSIHNFINVNVAKALKSIGSQNKQMGVTVANEDIKLEQKGTVSS